MRVVSFESMLALFVLLVASFTSSGAADEPKPDALTAEQILDKMAKTYAECKSYRDSGVVTTVFIQATGNRTVEKPFTTSFVRPDRFRFEFKNRNAANKEMRYIVWRSGKVVQTWWDLRPKVVTPASLALGLAGATGVSSGTAHTVPTLLLPEEVRGRKLTDLSDGNRIEDAKLDKAECFRVEGKVGKSSLTLWIDATTFLLRKIDSQQGFENFRTEQVTTYDPEIDGEVTDKMLEFDPPQ